MRRLVVLGSTGSIGSQVLDLLPELPEPTRVAGLACGSAVDSLLEQVERWNPDWVAAAEPAVEEELTRRLRGTGTRVVPGPDSASRLVEAAEPDLLVTAIPGPEGAAPTAVALQAGCPVLLASKEVLALAGSVLPGIARAAGTEILALDSELTAADRCLREGGRPAQRLILTASGGPFAQHPELDLAGVTPAEALRHPRWRMGPKVTIDSATLMNKGLELIGARWLLQLPPERISILIHPESRVHALVEYPEGELVARLSPPDMRYAISAALAAVGWTGVVLPPLDLVAAGPLTFREPDPIRFPCLRLARLACRAGPAACAALSAADGVAVQAFLAGRLRFDRIPALVEATLDRLPSFPVEGLEDLLEVDRWARERAQGLVG